MNKRSWPASSFACAAAIAISGMPTSATAAETCPRVEIAAFVGPGVQPTRHIRDEAGQPVTLAAADLVSSADLTRGHVNVTDG
jgi:hypothetical protein